MAKYDDIISGIFFDRYEAGATSVRFERDDLAAKAHQLKIAVPKFGRYYLHLQISQKVTSGNN